MDGSTQSFEDIAIRSRATLLKILEKRGYNTKPYQGLGPDEIAALLSNENALEMELSAADDPEKKCLVLYRFNRIKLSLANFVQKLLDPEDQYRVDAKTTEVVVVTMEPIVDAFHSAALEAWSTHKLRIQFFWMPSIVNDPMDHVLQPKFEKVAQESHTQLLKDNYAKSKTQFPMIRYHADMAARCIGLVPGDIVKIVRPSPASGEYTLYRVCVP